MDLRIKINLENAAFDNDGHSACGIETARILRCLANKLESGGVEEGLTIVLRDINGNKVGAAEVTD